MVYAIFIRSTIDRRWVHFGIRGAFAQITRLLNGSCVVRPNWWLLTVLLKSIKVDISRFDHVRVSCLGGQARPIYNFLDERGFARANHNERLPLWFLVVIIAETDVVFDLVQKGHPVSQGIWTYHVVLERISKHVFDAPSFFFMNKI